MHLDIILPTYNRDSLLGQALESLLVANVPEGMRVEIVVVDNNSTDNTPALVEKWKEKFNGRLRYMFEAKQGRSYALNAGIQATSGDLIGFIDDDEEIASDWYEVVQKAFLTMGVDFIGGPYIPKWDQSPPPWLPEKYRGVIGWIDAGNKPIIFDEDFSGILMGGNAVISRAVLEKVGNYRTYLSRSGTRLLSGEDEEMYCRLLAAKARGFYLPELRIFHYIPASRLTKRYHRSWCLWHGVSLGVLDRVNPQSVDYFGGVPRYLYGDALRGLWSNWISLLRRTRTPAEWFANELAVWDLIGFFYGKHYYRSELS